MMFQADRMDLLAALSEAVLFDAYQVPAPVIRRVRCACGDWLSAAACDDRALFAAVVTHNESTAHQQWRRFQEEA